MVVPALNESDVIGNTLADVAALTAPDVEVIVVDGGSTDDTVAVASRHTTRVIHAPRGRARQMNAGAREATGEVLWFCHADTRVPPDAGEALLNAISAGHLWGRFDVRLSGDSPTLRVVERLMNLRSRASGIATGDQGIFVTRELFDATGGYPEIPLMEDIALSKKLRAAGRPACLRDRLVTSSRRWEQNGVWRTVLLMWRLRLSYVLGADPERLARHYHQ